ncbi:MAG: hypothetical protein AAB858_02130 [Patescibacteria group bacterium]
MTNAKEYKIKEKELRWLGIDLDNCVAHSNYPDYKLLKPITGAKGALKRLEKDGWKIIIHTSRGWAEYDTIEKWLTKNKIPFRRIVCGKLFAKYYIDDRNIAFNGNWKEVVSKIDGTLKT